MAARIKKAEHFFYHFTKFDCFREETKLWINNDKFTLNERTFIGISIRMEK